MILKSMVLGLFGGMLVAAPAQAARILYAYADSSGRAVTTITDGFARGSQFSPAALCLQNGATCTSARFFANNGAVVMPTGGPGGSDSALLFEDADLSRPGIYTRDTGTVLGQLAIIELQDSDIVYSYADTLGRSVTAVLGSYARFIQTSPALLCLQGMSACDSARFFSSNGLAVIPWSSLVGGSAVTFEDASANLPGTYTRDTGTALAQLAVSGPVASAVPEPTTWAMLVGGFGLIGGVLRVRRRTIMLPVTD